MSSFDCMTDEELMLWREAADTARRFIDGATTKPCTDCPLSFRTAEYLAGRCCLPAPVVHARTSARRSYNREWMRLYRARSKGAYTVGAGTSSSPTIPDAVPLLVPEGTASSFVGRD